MSEPIITFKKINDVKKAKELLIFSNPAELEKWLCLWGKKY